MKNKKVLLGMSGGVDSSAAAILLKNEGYEVRGATMRLWEDEENNKIKSCGNKYSATEDAKKVCSLLNIPHYTLNYEEEFKKYVIEDFIKCYKCAKTPNPCVRCNKYIKFNYFYKKALELGCDYIATGHYAKIEEKDGRYLLIRSDDDRKDQTYALYNFTQDQLAHTLMPCGEYTKDRIREIAKEIGLSVYNKKDSEEICFIPDNDHGRYIKEARPLEVVPGNFVDKNGNVLGQHKGIVYYTIGQRKGLGIALGRPVFVTDINPMTNEVVLGPETDIFKTDLVAKDVNFIPFDKLEGEITVEAKVRYSGRPAEAVISPMENGRVKVSFKEKQRAITKGQSVVFYQGNMVVGGGIIEGLI